MLHNLLPRDIKKSLRNEYIVRLASMALFLVAASVAVGGVSLVPAYISVSSSLEEITSTDNEKDAEDSTPARDLARATDLLATLDAKLSAEPMTEIMADIISVHPEGVSITGITFERNPLSFSLRGVASTRDALIAYKKALEGHEWVTSVSSPLTDLAKSADLEFTLAVNLNEKRP